VRRGRCVAGSRRGSMPGCHRCWALALPSGDPALRPGEASQQSRCPRGSSGSARMKKKMSGGRPSIAGKSTDRRHDQANHRLLQARSSAWGLPRRCRWTSLPFRAPRNVSVDSGSTSATSRPFWTRCPATFGPRHRQQELSEGFSQCFLRIMRADAFIRRVALQQARAISADFYGTRSPAVRGRSL
jgi:hypothetical protein